MIIILKKDADQSQVENLKCWLKDRNITPHVSEGAHETLIGCVGDVRGLNAPPRRSVAPAAFTALAIETICSSLSTLHGPAITWKFPPPIFGPEQSTTVSSG